MVGPPSLSSSGSQRSPPRTPPELRWSALAWRSRSRRAAGSCRPRRGCRRSPDPKPEAARWCWRDPATAALVGARGHAGHHTASAKVTSAPISRPHACSIVKPGPGRRDAARPRGCVLPARGQQRQRLSAWRSCPSMPRVMSSTHTRWRPRGAAAGTRAWLSRSSDARHQVGVLGEPALGERSQPLRRAIVSLPRQSPPTVSGQQTGTRTKRCLPTRRRCPLIWMGGPAPAPPPAPLRAGGVCTAPGPV